jgi:hypothetical protein
VRTLALAARSWPSDLIRRLGGAFGSVKTGMYRLTKTLAPFSRPRSVSPRAAALEKTEPGGRRAAGPSPATAAPQGGVSPASPSFSLLNFLPAAHAPDTRRRLGTEEGPATLWPLCAGDVAQRRTAVGGAPFAPEGVLSFGRGGGVPPSTALFFDRRLGMPMRVGSRGTARPRWRRSLPAMPVSLSIFSFDLLLGDLTFELLLGGMN